jgi:hypothetical protein
MAHEKYTILVQKLYGHSSRYADVNRRTGGEAKGKGMVRLNWLMIVYWPGFGEHGDEPESLIRAGNSLTS